MFGLLENAPAQYFQSNAAVLKDAVFTINPNQAGTVRFEKSIEVNGNCVMQNYDKGILLARGIREGKLPVVDQPKERE